MKLNSIYAVSYNKVITAVAVMFVFIATANASGEPAKNVPAHNYKVTAPQETPAGVVYASIDASANQKSVLVKWVTASEMNNSHFEVERSYDMKEFKTVALILDGFTAEGTGKTYEFKESAGEVKNGKTVYYRLKQFDNNGKVSYSTILAVKLQTNAADALMQLFPNPATNSLNVHINKLEKGIAEVRIVTLSGKTLLSKQSTIVKGNTNIQVDGLSGLTAGMYMAQLLVNGTVVENQHLVKE